jgi:hypothetical protein
MAAIQEFRDLVLIRRASIRELGREGLHESDGERQPIPQRLLVMRGRIDKNIALHPPTRHLHGLCARPRQCTVGLCRRGRA